MPPTPATLTQAFALHQQGRLQEALPFYDQAISQQPNLAIAYRGRGLALMDLGKAELALNSLFAAVQLAPEDVVALNAMGVILLSLGKTPDALACFDRSLALQPNDPTANHNRGLALISQGHPAQALAGFERTLQLAPNSQPTWIWKGKCCIELGRVDEAIVCFQQAIRLAPQDFGAHFQLGLLLSRMNHNAAAVTAFNAAVACNARSAEALNNRGAVLVRLFRPAEALADFQRALELNPGYADAYINYGNTLKGLGQYPAALNQLNRALTLKPDDTTVRWSKATLLLALGDFAAGWPLYEARLQLDPARRFQRDFRQPRWTGSEPLSGKSLLVHAEQGLGDTLQFARYIRPLEALGARVTFEVQPALLQLLRSLNMTGTLLARGAPLPDTDFHIPLLSLPLALGTRLDSIPAAVPYVSVDPEAQRLWRERLAALPGRKIGINWHGNPAAERFSALQARSFPLAAAAPLARLPDVTLISLQKGAGAEQREQVDFANRIMQLTDPQHLGAAEIATETAAIIKGLDLVITADTALAHLAGALGANVWLVLQSVADWRWLIDRADSPWYPTMRVFRQRTAADWPEMFERMAAELARSPAS